jgi:hypothetical protein
MFDWLVHPENLLALSMSSLFTCILFFTLGVRQ